MIFNLGLKYKVEGKDFFQKLVKLLINSLFGGNIRTDKTEEDSC